MGNVSRELRLDVAQLPVSVLNAEIHFVESSMRTFRDEMKELFPDATISDKFSRYLRLLKNTKMNKMREK